jgi:hypothetical protein
MTYPSLTYSCLLKHYTGGRTIVMPVPETFMEIGSACNQARSIYQFSRFQLSLLSSLVARRVLHRVITSLLVHPSIVLQQSNMSRFHLLLILFLPFFASTSRPCYLPNGTVDNYAQSCFPQNPDSSCCDGSTFVCATNNMCAKFDGSLYIIGSCTDQTWNSPACPGYCYFHQ